MTDKQVTESQKVSSYFHNKAQSFDTIYDEEKSAFQHWLDETFRRDMRERFELTLHYCADIEGGSVLDLGCGTGRYGIELAHRGATRVLGIDIADNMISMAQELAAEYDPNGACEFVLADFMEFDTDERFDYVIALGVFDYVADAPALLSKMMDYSRKGVVASFPTKSIGRQQFREFRYNLKSCPLYFYDQVDLRNLLGEVGAGTHEIKKIEGWGLDFVVYVDTSSQASG